MEFKLIDAIPVLERTPDVVISLLNGLDDKWLHSNEGNETWSPYDIVGHLIYGEKTDWIVRMEIILSHSSEKTFEPFDRFAQFEESRGKDLDQLLKEFSELRKKNMDILISKNLQEYDFEKKGIHPLFGEVTLKNLLATWVAHDLGHIAQITRVMAKQYKEEVGPWRIFLPVMDR